MKSMTFGIMKKLYGAIRYLSYATGCLALVILIYAKFTGSEEKLMTGFLFAGSTFILFLISYAVYWLIRLIAKTHAQEDEQINP